MNTWRIAVLVGLALLLGAGAVGADNSHMPIVRETSATSIYVHVIACPAWPGQQQPISGHRVEVYGDGSRIIWATTTTSGDAIMQAPLPGVVTVSLDTGQSVTVRRGDGALAVAFWVGRCATVATNWARE